MSFVCAMLVALALDWCIGWPNWLFQRIGHPVSWIGAMISSGEARFNRGQNRSKLINGGALALFVIATCVLIGLVFQGLIISQMPWWLAGLILGILAWPFSAARSLHDHIKDILIPLEGGDLVEARQNVAKIVGRNPENLDENAIRRAALESLSENTSDGVVAPIFWGLCFGLPGILGYKAINTLDSMIAYRNERYLYFGRTAAHIDDVANFPAARLCAILYAMAAFRFSIIKGLRVEAKKHRSPNAGWPETAMARAIGVRLSGPRFYDGKPSDDQWLNGQNSDPDNLAFRAGLSLYIKLNLIIGVLLVFAALVLVNA